MLQMIHMGQERSDALPLAKTTEFQFIDMVMSYKQWII